MFIGLRPFILRVSSLLCMEKNFWQSSGFYCPLCANSRVGPILGCNAACWLPDCPAPPPSFRLDLAKVRRYPCSDAPDSLHVWITLSNETFSFARQILLHYFLAPRLTSIVVCLTPFNSSRGRRYLVDPPSGRSRAVYYFARGLKLRSFRAISYSNCLLFIGPSCTGSLP